VGLFSKKPKEVGRLEFAPTYFWREVGAKWSGPAVARAFMPAAVLDYTLLSIDEAARAVFTKNVLDMTKSSPGLDGTTTSESSGSYQCVDRDWGSVAVLCYTTFPELDAIVDPWQHVTCEIAAGQGARGLSVNIEPRETVNEPVYVTLGTAVWDWLATDPETTYGQLRLGFRIYGAVAAMHAQAVAESRRLSTRDLGKIFAEAASYVRDHP
jgi:hypothetical protein